jgi:hypothetical protein
MKFPLCLHRLQIWDPATGKMRQRFFFRPQIVIGGDPKSDLRLGDLEGIFAKIDFTAGDLDLLREGRSLKILPKEIFTIGPYAVLWMPLDAGILNRWKYSLGGTAGLFLAVCLFVFFKGSEAVCTQLEVRLARQQFTDRRLSEEEQRFLSEIRMSLESARLAFAEKSWIKLKAEIREMDEKLDAATQRRDCRTDKAVRDLEFKMRRSLFREHLEHRELAEALPILQEMISTTGSKGTSGLRRDLLRAARELYLEGYRREDESPDEGTEIKDRATEVCTQLGYESCFEGVNELKPNSKGESGDQKSLN